MSRDRCHQNRTEDKGDLRELELSLEVVFDSVKYMPRGIRHFHPTSRLSNSVFDDQSLYDRQMG